MGEKPKLFYGWKVLIALFVIGAIGPVARYGLTAFFPSIQADLGWSRSEIGLAQSIALWVYAGLSIPAGWMVDRLGGRKTMLLGGVLCLFGWLLLSTMQSLWQMYIYYGIFMAMIVSVTHLVSTQSTSRKWFIKRAGLAAGIIGSAFAIGSAVFTPIITTLSDAYGWRPVAVGCAFATSIPILLLAWFVVRDTPESVGLHPDGAVTPSDIKAQKLNSSREWPLKEALKSPQLWLLFAAYSFSGMVINGLLAHMVVWVTDFGASVALAGLFTTLYSVPSLASRVSGGLLGDRFGKAKMLVVGTGLAGLITLLAWRGEVSLTALWFIIPVMGLGMNMATGLYPPHLGDLFGRRNVGTLFAILTAGWGLIGGFGPMLWGYIYDKTHSYDLALLISIICYALAVGALLLIRWLPAKKEVVKGSQALNSNL